MTLRSHTADQWKRSSPSIRDIDRDISEVLTHPPDTEHSRESISLSVVEYPRKYQRCHALEEAPTEYIEKVSEWHHDEVSAFVKSSIDEVHESHRFIVDHSE